MYIQVVCSLSEAYSLMGKECHEGSSVWQFEHHTASMFQNILGWIAIIGSQVPHCNQKLPVSTATVEFLRRGITGSIWRLFLIEKGVSNPALLNQQAVTPTQKCEQWTIEYKPGCRGAGS